MGHSHDHSRGHRHGPLPGEAGERHRRPLALALALVLGFVGVQVVTGVLTSSLALISDAGHMAADALGLAMALAALHFARRPATGTRHTYGMYRLEILAAAANAAVLMGVVAYALYEGVGRLRDPVEISPGPVLAVGAAGLLVNVACFLLLRSGADESINVRGAYLEVVADMVGSVGVVAAAITIWLTGWQWVDAAAGIAIAAFIAPRAIRLGLEAMRILLQQAPAGLDVEALRRDLAGLPGVEDVHDLHVWTLTSTMDVLTAHLVSSPTADHADVLRDGRDLLSERYGITHATLQVEADDLVDCGTPGW